LRRSASCNPIGAPGGRFRVMAGAGGPMRAMGVPEPGGWWPEVVPCGREPDQGCGRGTSCTARVPDRPGSTPSRTSQTGTLSRDVAGPTAESRADSGPTAGDPTPSGGEAAPALAGDGTSPVATV